MSMDIIDHYACADLVLQLFKESNQLRIIEVMKEESAGQYVKPPRLKLPGKNIQGFILYPTGGRCIGNREFYHIGIRVDAGQRRIYASFFQNFPREF